MIELMERPLLEHNITYNENLGNVIDWCCACGTFLHKDAVNEFLFWIPPLEGHLQYIRQTYGENIPKEILEPLVQAVKKQADKPDQGYLLISFI